MGYIVIYLDKIYIYVYWYHDLFQYVYIFTYLFIFYLFISDGTANTDITIGNDGDFRLCKKISTGEYVDTIYVNCSSRQVGRIVRVQKNVYSNEAVEMCLCEVQVYGYLFNGTFTVYVDVQQTEFLLFIIIVSCIEKPGVFYIEIRAISSPSAACQTVYP